LNFNSNSTLNFENKTIRNFNSNSTLITARSGQPRAVSFARLGRRSGFGLLGATGHRSVEDEAMDQMQAQCGLFSIFLIRYSIIILRKFI
jgi:hypothetical protein